jgi:hypothetical protein
MAGRHLSPPSKKRVPTIRLINIPPQRSAQRSPPINNRRARRENRLATGCSPSLSLPRGARAGDRPTDRQAASHGQARARQVPRRGGVLPAGGSGRRQVPVHDGEPAAAVGLHPQGVRDRVPAAAADGGRRRDGEPGARHRGLLPLPHHGRHVRHHRRHRRPHPRCVRVYTRASSSSCRVSHLHCTARTNVYMSLQSSFIHSHGPSSLLSVCVFVFAKKKKTKQNKKMQ